MSEEAKAQIQATVRVIVSLDVEVTWRDGECGMVRASGDAVRKAEVAVGGAMGAAGVKLAKGTSPKGTARRVTANLEMM